ncbi:MAG TPA: TolC family protein [Pirellulales bacterium]|jgi:NodT family efflux transporter outer membrane factor (OMF) lipoprotein|nr:TolC family protein [Pirellulales bacterium]
MFRLSPRIVAAWGLLLGLCAWGGCTSPQEYVHNGLKVGPNYTPPCGPVADHWIDVADMRVHQQTDDISHWWAVFNDPKLNELVLNAYHQNLTLREAGFRILQARATLGIAQGNFWPQTQTANGGYTRIRTSGGGGLSGASFDRFNFGFNLAWELDFWGRFRRAIESADDALEASVADYDDVLVTLIGDVASNYVTIRTDQERIRLLSANVAIQRDVYEVGKRRLREGAIGDLDVQQSEANLKQTMAQIPETEIDLRQASNRLCVLLGIPPRDLSEMLGDGSIPYTPNDVVVGIPADLLRRRPDVRRAERNAAAQCEMIGIAEAQYYPAFSVLGNLGWQATTFSGLFRSEAFNGSVGPQFNWDILNYGRILNNVRLQEARFQELVANFQQTVLQADADVENGIITFLRAQDAAKDLGESVAAGKTARDVSLQLYEKGEKGFDFNRYAVIQQNLIQQEDAWVQERGQIAQGLIAVYRGLGGGWQIRCTPESADGTIIVAPDQAGAVPGTGPAEELPKPPAAAPNGAPADLLPPGAAPNRAGAKEGAPGMGLPRGTTPPPPDLPPVKPMETLPKLTDPASAGAK